MSTAASAPAGAAGATPAGPTPELRAPVGEACPLCGAPLHPEQEWCLNCGAAARTRLAASPNWKAPLTVVLIVVVLSLGVLAAALVKLAGNTGPEVPASTRTVTTAALAPSTATTASTPTLSTQTTSAATTPSTSTTTPGAGSPAGGAATTTAPAGALPRSLRSLSKRTGIPIERLRKLGLLPAK